MSLQDELRKVCLDLRVRPIAIKDLIPLMQRAADRLDELENAESNLQFSEHLRRVGR